LNRKMKRVYKEGVNMLTVKKKEEYRVATKEEVLAALKIINEKNGKVMRILAES
jgi:hypothetical protein